MIIRSSSHRTRPKDLGHPRTLGPS
jgi:hypothetical protein